MTEQLMDDLTNEEHEALLLMSEHAIAPPLSPAAQAVHDAAFSELPDGLCLKAALAAALRAVAEQMSCYQSRKFLYSIADAMKLHAIAAELEAQ
jgi:hypothetical protein